MWLHPYFGGVFWSYTNQIQHGLKCCTETPAALGRRVHSLFVLTSFEWIPQTVSCVHLRARGAGALLRSGRLRDLKGGQKAPNWTSESGKTIYLSDHSLTRHLPLRTPRAGRAAARHSHNSRPRRGPRTNKAIRKHSCSVRGWKREA